MISFIVWTVWEATHGALSVGEQISELAMIVGELAGVAATSAAYLMMSYAYRDLAKEKNN